MRDVGQARIDGMGWHPRIAETHTGMVFLVGDRAYKIKKPVLTDFLDFSTVERRESACADEVALNRRLAPDSYLASPTSPTPTGRRTGDRHASPPPTSCDWRRW